MDVLSALSTARLVPVVVVDDAADANALAGALVAGGLPVAEVTFRTAAAQDSIRAMSARGDILVGAGTVLTVAQVDQAVAAGASFVVSPGLSRAVVERCQEKGVGASGGGHRDRGPGCARARHQYGEVLPSRHFRRRHRDQGARCSVRRCQLRPHRRSRPQEPCGVPRDPLVAAVGGSWMVPRDLVKSGDFAGIQALTVEAVAMVRTLSTRTL